MFIDDDIERDPLWKESDVKVYIDAFEKTGFGKALNWYRNMDTNILWDLDNGITDKSVIKIPCLMVSAKYDLVLTSAEAQKMKNNFENLTSVVLECGHWTMKEKEHELNELLAEWLTGRQFNVKKRSNL